MYIVNRTVVTGRKEFSSCLVFLINIFVKGVHIFDKVVAGCGFLNSLKYLWGIFKSLIFGCKVGVFNISEKLQEVVQETMLKFGSTNGFTWKQKEKLI